MKDDLPADLIHQLRQLMPIDMLTLMNRPLTYVEAQAVAEAQATKLLRLIGAGPPNAEVERLSELPGLEVKFASNLPVSGLSEWFEGRWVVGINRSDDLWRCRATLCHELKHILDDPYRELLYPRSNHQEHQVPQSAERLCNYFAGCTLVPREWLVSAWRDGCRDVGELAAHFNVSRSLMRVRIRQVDPGARDHHSLLPRYLRQSVLRRPSTSPRNTLPRQISLSRHPCSQLKVAAVAINQ